MMDKDRAELRQRYKELDAKALVRIVYAEPGDYRPEAVAVASEELVRRGIRADSDEQLQEYVRKAKRQRQEFEEQPLPVWLKVICFVFCGVPGIAIAIHQSTRRGERRGREAWAWVGYGWLCRVGIGAARLLGRCR